MTVAREWQMLFYDSFASILRGRNFIAIFIPFFIFINKKKDTESDEPHE
jgi:hypothetical protein